jgi:hypothetical protein
VLTITIEASYEINERRTLPASLEVVPARLMKGTTSPSGFYEQSIGFDKSPSRRGNSITEDFRALSIKEVVDCIVTRADSLIAEAEMSIRFLSWIL